MKISFSSSLLQQHSVSFSLQTDFILWINVCTLWISRPDNWSKLIRMVFLIVTSCQLCQQYRRRCFRPQSFRSDRTVQPLPFRLDRSLQTFSSRLLHTTAGKCTQTGSSRFAATPLRTRWSNEETRPGRVLVSKYVTHVISEAAQPERCASSSCAATCCIFRGWQGEFICKHYCSDSAAFWKCAVTISMSMLKLTKKASSIGGFLHRNFNRQTWQKQLSKRSIDEGSRRCPSLAPTPSLVISLLCRDSGDLLVSNLFLSELICYWYVFPCSRPRADRPVQAVWYWRRNHRGDGEGVVGGTQRQEILKQPKTNHRKHEHAKPTPQKNPQNPQKHWPEK